MAVTMCPAPGQITVILCVRRAATSQPGRIAANLFARRSGKSRQIVGFAPEYIAKKSLDGHRRI